MYRKNVSGQHFCFQGVDTATGGIKSGVSWTVRRSIDGTFAAATGTAAEDGTTGWYEFAMSQADTNGNNIAFNFTGTGAVPQTVNILTTAADPSDTVRFGLTALPNAAAEAAGGLYTRGTGAGQINQAANGMADANLVRWLGTAAATPTVAGVPEVDVTHILGTAAFAASAGYFAADIRKVDGFNNAVVGFVPADVYKSEAISLTAHVAGQFPVDVSSYGGSAGTFAAGRPEVNTTHAAGTAWAAGAITAASLAADAGAEIAAAVWDLDATAHQTQGTFGQAIGDPVADTGTIFKAVVTDATGVTVGTDTATLLTRMGTPSDLGGGATLAGNLSDIEAQTDDIGVAGAGLTNINLPDQTMDIVGNITGNLSGSVGSVTAAVTVGTINANVVNASALATDAAAEIADKVLGRNLAGGVDGTRTVQDALRAIRNKTAIVAGTLTVYAEDDATPAWTAVVTTAAGNPLASVDPA